MWLDEALTVNIASAPVGEIVRHLRNDGAPPLYYFVLHLWISVFGPSDFSSRSLSGCFSVIGCLAAFALARRLWGTQYAVVATAVLAVLPFGVYFGTEARMYSLVMLESALLLFVWIGDWSKSPGRDAVATALLAASLLYTHYWSLYLIAVMVIGLVIQCVRSRIVTRDARFKMIGVFGGAVLWLPWVPVFNAQRLHTGTPWSPAPAFFQFLNWIEGFITNQSRQHITPSLHHEVVMLLFIGLIVMGCFAVVMKDRYVVKLDFQIPREVKFLVGISFGTMFLGLLASHFADTTFVPRYASVIAIPIALIVARGIMVFDRPLRILMVLLLFSVGALWTDKWGRGVQRTQAGEVSAVLVGAKPDAYVFMCPDQIGPTVMRYARHDLSYSAYPRYTEPFFVDWYDYKDAFKATSPRDAGAKVLAASGNRDIYVVWSSGYTLKGTCKAVAHEITNATGRTATRLLKARATGFYQSMNVTLLPFR
ncbi:MAG: glycosyltransferase family 39 protein [Actinobacteria bacterium]|nr:glycosyltransferase family 39 protein [Actinomycetota bacterium]